MTQEILTIELARVEGGNIFSSIIFIQISKRFSMYFKLN